MDDGTIYQPAEPRNDEDASALKAQSPEERLARKRERRRHRDKEYARRKLAEDGYREKKRAWHRDWSSRNREHVNNRRRAYTAKNKERMKLLGQRCREKARTNPSGRMKLLLYQCLGRSRQKGWPADRPFLLRFIAHPPINCECCHRAFDFNATGRALAGPSFDRIDNAKGYVAGNVGVICFECNMIKNSGTLEQHEAIVAYMRRHLEPQQKPPVALRYPFHKPRIAP